MNFLAISGSGRAASTNTAMLRSVSYHAQPQHRVTVFSGVAKLPIFSPDREAGPLPYSVLQFVELVASSDGVIIASPEYVRAIPGGLKNAIDWLVSREEIIKKPVALMHASHRGDDMLAQLRLVMSTVSERFSQELFERFELMNCSPEEVSQQLATMENRSAINEFLNRFAQHCKQ